MKLTTFLLIVATLQSFAIGYGQSSMIKLAKETQTLSSVIEAIENQTDYKIFYKTDQVDVTQFVNIDINEATVASVLDEALDGTHLSYVVMDKLIVFAPAETINQPPTVTGTITDATTNEPLVGVNISIEGTGKGVISDIKGKYNIEVRDINSTLVFSYVGYATMKISVSGKSTINVSLVPIITNLEEVVVVGYGQQRKSDITGSISSVKGVELAQLPLQRVDQALQGRAAGVLVLTQAGAPGAATTIRIRGMNSINGSNAALIVIDGLQGGNLNSLNPNDIEGMEILKDASATAIYGAQGANGVILITTKSGIKGKPTIDYSYDLSFQKIRHKIDVMNAADYAVTRNAFRETDNQFGPKTPFFTDSEIQDFRKNGGTDWQDVLYRTAPMQNHQLSISGGTDNLKYMISGGYLNQEGILVNSEYKRFTLRTNISGDITKKVGFAFNWAGSKEAGNSPPYGGGTALSFLGQAVNLAPRWYPTLKPYDDQGNYSRPNTGSYGPYDTWNPLAAAKEPIIDNNTIRNNLQGTLSFKLLEGLTLRVTGGAMLRNDDNLRYYNSKTREGQPVQGKVGYGTAFNSISLHFQNSNILTYDKVFNSHHITVMGTIEQQFDKYKETSITAQKFTVDQTGINNLAGASQLNNNSTSSERVLNSYLGRINYAYANKYLLTVSYRADGSSVFGANNKWGFFPSGSLAWRMSQESFIQNLNIFSDLKLRASWGITGSQAINPYQTFAQMTSDDQMYPYNGNSTTDIGFVISSAANPNLKWESTTQSDIGLDASFFKGRLSLTADVYKKITKDLLLARDLPGYTGLSSMMDNIGSMENKGLELSITGDPFTGEVKWSTGFNISWFQTTVLDLGGKTRLSYSTSYGGYGIGQLMTLVPGEPFGQMYGWTTLGTWKTTESEEAAAYGQLPGDMKYLDINNDGKINTADFHAIGNAMPKYIFGWTNRVSFKNCDLTVLTQGTQGNKVFNQARIRLENGVEGTSTHLLDRWTPSNQDTDVPAFTDWVTRHDAALPSSSISGVDNRISRYIEDASYLRVKNITLAYNFSGSLLNKAGIKTLRAYLSGTNLITVTKYTGYDPEVSAYNDNDAKIGVDLSNYPTAKTFSFGINLTF